MSAVALALAGCGRSGQGASTDSEKAADVEELNVVLSQELTTVGAYEQAMPLLRGRALAVADQFRGQSQAHVDALTKAIRGVGGKTDAEATELEEPPESREGALLLAYEMENASLTEALDATPHLNTASPRTLTASLAASHAQHLTVLRQLLGSGLTGSAPEAFENGEVPPPTPPGKEG